MANLMSLPCDVIYHILIQENIGIKDVVNLSLTCKRLYIAINNSYIWRCKFFQRWPSLRQVHADRFNKYENIKEMLREGIGYEKELLCCLAFLPYLYDNREYDIRFREYIGRLRFLFDAAEDTYSLRYHCFHDKLIKLMEADPLDEGTNLTNLYCAQRFIVHMTQSDTTYKWKKLRRLSNEQQTAEKIATLVAHWCQPRKLVFHSDVAASLDTIVQQILKALKGVHPTHSIFATSAERFSLWENKNIDDNYWNAQESRQIIDIIGRVIFRELNFNICSVDSEETFVDPNIFFIDQVLESKDASPVLLQIIIQSLARRLGVRCDLLYSTGELLLCWKESYNPSRYERNYHCIDLSSAGFFLSKDVCVVYRSSENAINISRMEVANPVELVRCLTAYISVHLEYYDREVKQSCFVLELRYMVQEPLGSITCASSDSPPNRPKLRWPPDGFNEDSENEFSWSTLFHLDAIEKNLTLQKLMFAIGGERGLRTIKSDFADYIFSILSRYPRRKIQFISGRELLKYRTGMLVEIEMPFKSAGVIIGWTLEYCNSNNYPLWPVNDHISEQITCTPIYTILVCGNGRLELCQEFIKPLKMQKWINNSEIGQYFSHFKGTHYVPNQLLRWRYPMDAHILKRKYSNS